ncbi:PEP-CTERM sorting domain-containing protein [Planctomycetota bacterium]|nr:PEP-CTERM sorting domain-containing protein [Planctomycetota bacterium]
MKRTLFGITAAVTMTFSFAAHSNAAMLEIIEPVAVVELDYFKTTYMFDIDGLTYTEGTFTEPNDHFNLVDPNQHQGWSQANNGTRYSYVDFGEDWESIRIAEVWSLYRPFTANQAEGVGLSSMWWDDDTDKIQDVGDPSVTEFALGSYDLVNNSSGQLWRPDVKVPAIDAFALGGRYLMINGQSGFHGRINEIAFVGFVPEPASMVLISLGSIALLSRRRLA